jgi:hypothetical protein
MNESVPDDIWNLILAHPDELMGAPQKRPRDGELWWAVECELGVDVAAFVDKVRQQGFPQADEGNFASAFWARPVAPGD